MSAYLASSPSGIWHYRRVVPPVARKLAGQSVWKQTLRTAELREAEARARLLAVEHDALIAAAKGGSPADRLAVLRRSVADGKWQRMTEKRLVAHVTEATHAEFDGIEQTLVAASDKLAALTDDERRRVEQAGGLAKLYVAYRKLRQTPIKGDEFDVQAHRLRLAAYESILRKVGFDIPQGEDDPNDPRLSSVVEPWFAARKQDVLAQRRHRVAINRFIELHGDVPVRSITREHVKDYVARIENCANQQHVPVSQRGTLADPGPDVPRVSAATVERHLVSVKALLGFCVEQNWVATNVATGIRPPKDTRPKASKRRPFRLEERRTVLAQAIEEGGENGDMAWLIRLGAYTGCRLEELAQLARDNVGEIDGIACIEIDDLAGRNIKNAGSVRTVPLHPAIRHDFMEWVRKGRGKRVFTSFTPDRDGRFANEVSGDFARLMDRAALPDPRLTFHSLRHTLKRAMSDAGLDPDVRRAVLGHAARDVHDTYGGGVSLARVAEELERLPPLF